MSDLSPEKLRKMREEKGLTQYDVSELVGIRAGTISKMESGQFFSESTAEEIEQAIQKADNQTDEDVYAKDLIGDDNLTLISPEHQIDELLDSNYKTTNIFIIYSNGDILGWVENSEAQNYGAKTNITEVMNTDFMQISPDTTLNEVVDILQDYSAVVITTADEVIGIIRREGM